MKYCPDPDCPASRPGEAARQYRDELEFCSACGTALKTTPGSAPESDQDLVVLDRFSIGHEAHMARALLEAEKIPAVVQQDHGQFMSVGMGAALMVPEAYLDVARRVLQRGPNDIPEESEPEEPEDESTAQAARVRKIGRASRYVAFLAILYLVLGSFYGFANLTRVNNLRTYLEAVPDELQVPAYLLRGGYEDLLRDPETGELLSAGEVRQSLRLHSVAGFLNGYILAFCFGAVYLWAKRSPVPALIVGLCVYLVLLVVEAVLDPTSILQGWLLKALVIGALLAGVREAIQETAYLESLEGTEVPAP